MLEFKASIMLIVSLVSVAGCLGYDVLARGRTRRRRRTRFQLLVV